MLIQILLYWILVLLELYLKKNTEETGHLWSEKISRLLCEMNETWKEYQRKNIYFRQEEIKEYQKRYQKNHLLFLRDFSVPFENNLSERDLRVGGMVGGAAVLG